MLIFSSPTGVKMNSSGQAMEVPGDFVECSELDIASVEQKLGYFGDAPLVIFAYCAGGAEVIWKDGNSSGFGTGGWQIFLEEIAPLALLHGVDLGSIGSAGTHVLLIDRQQHVVYAAPRRSADCFLCRHYGLAPPARQCLCGLPDCEASSCNHIDR
jgi:hypothetical protein